MRSTVNPSVILSTWGGCASVHAGIHLPLPRTGTPVPCQVQPPAGQVHPPGRYTPRQVDPPSRYTPKYTLTPPPTPTRFASYWNAFLFNKLSTGNIVFTCPKKLNILLQVIDCSIYQRIYNGKPFVLVFSPALTWLSWMRPDPKGHFSEENPTKLKVGPLRHLLIC